MIKNLLKEHDAVVMLTTGDLREFVQELLAELKAPAEEPLYLPEEFAKRKRVSRSQI